MSTVVTTHYQDSVLEIDKRYLVQEVSKFPKSKSFMIGQHCVLKQIVGSTAHVMFTGRMTDIPVRSLIQVKGYTAKSVNAKNADGFVVIKQNSLGIPVGTAYLNHDKARSDSKNVFAVVDGKTIIIPFEYLSALVKDKEKVAKTAKIAEKTGISPKIVEAVAELYAPADNRQDHSEIPAAIVKLLPGVNLVELRDIIRMEESVYSDYNGGLHTTIADCDKANTKIRYKLLKDKLMSLVNTVLLGMWKV